MKIRFLNSIFCIFIIYLILGISFTTVYAINIQYKFKENLKSDYIDISIEEAWNLLSSPNNGIQIPIDIRGLQDWYAERIDTPYPEDPKRHGFFEQDGFEIFMDLYDGMEVIISCYSGSSSRNVAQMLIDKNFNGTVYNLVGGFNAWKDGGYPTKSNNDPPNTPSVPSGQNIGIIGNLYTFSTFSMDPDDDSIRYGWSWDGDYIVDEWSNYYLSETPALINHSWDITGSYDILVIAEDNVGIQSDFSSPLSMIITNQPNPPNINGISNGKTGEEYEYTFYISDPDDDNLYLFIDWGDDNIEDWIGPYKSGEEVILNHIFIEDGTYNINAKVRDIYDIESDWSEFEVVMPKNIIFKYNFFRHLIKLNNLFFMKFIIT